ncbi:MAG: hypothetical protein QOE46_1849 [Acidobacteriota bacterium]|jgi:hypothetical protein|nr:hypothetical protein [Acidobacteriota bacterium]
MKGLAVATYKITSHSLDEMRMAGLPDGVLRELESLRSQEVRGRKEFLIVLRQTIGHEETARHEKVLLKFAAARHRKPRPAAGKGNKFKWPFKKPSLQKPSLRHYAWKVIQSTLLGALLLLAIFGLDKLTDVLFPLAAIPPVDVIKWAKNWVSVGFFMVFLVVKILDNLGMIKD